jgi:hypothetical protein
VATGVVLLDSAAFGKGDLRGTYVGKNSAIPQAGEPDF